MSPGIPDAEVSIDVDLARRLIEQQCPRWSHLPVSAADSGWDNVMFRLGDSLALRLPRRIAAVASIACQYRWLPEVAARLPLAVPQSLFVGEPSADYPYPWLVVSWLPGAPAARTAVAPGQWQSLLGFFEALHQPPPPALPRNPFRGIALSGKQAALAPRLERIEPRLWSPVLAALWQRALSAPPTRQATWIHGDLHARNVLVDGQGRFTAVVDWGDLSQGDPAVDLAAVWSLLPEPADRQHCLLTHADPASWLRAAGWACFLGVVLVDSAGDDWEQATMGHDILKRLALDYSQLTTDVA